MIVSMQDELIMALADDELELPLADRVREAIRNDAEIRRKYDIFVGTRAVLSQAFDGIAREPVPERLKQTVTARSPRRRLS